MIVNALDDISYRNLRLYDCVPMFANIIRLHFSVSDK